MHNAGEATLDTSKLTQDDAARIASKYNAVLMILASIRAEMARAHLPALKDETLSEAELSHVRLLLQLDVTAYINALLNEARQVSFEMGGEKYGYDMFMLCLLGKKRIAEAKDAMAMATTSDPSTATKQHTPSDTINDLLNQFKPSATKPN